MFTPGDAEQAATQFDVWWRERDTERPAQDDYYAHDVAAAAWLAACQWCDGLRGDD